MTTCGGFVREMTSWTERCLASALRKRGHSITALTSNSVKKVFEASDSEVIDGIEVKRFTPLSPGSLFWMLKKDFDVIHSHFLGYMAPISSYAAIRKKMKSVPMVHTLNGLYHNPFLINDWKKPFTSINYRGIQKTFPLTKPWKFANWFSHLPLNTADMVLPQTHYEKSELINLGVPDAKLTVIPNGVDLRQFEFRNKRYFKEKYGIDGKMILFVGQLIESKGVDFLIRSMKNIVEEVDAKLVFISYKSNPSIVAMCHNLGLEDSVKFFSVSQHDKLSAYCSADVFCLPTLHEGFPGVILEAMAGGVPIVTTNIPVITEIVHNEKNGLLVPPRNSAAISRAILRLFNDKRLAHNITRNNSKYVKKFDWDKVAKMVEAVYESVIEG